MYAQMSRFPFTGVLPQNTVKFWQLPGLALFLNSLLFSGRASSTLDSSSFAPSKWDREMRISLVVNLFTAAVQFQHDIKLLITAEQTAPHRYSLSPMQPSSSSAGVGGSRRKCDWTHSISGVWPDSLKSQRSWERVPGIYTHLHFVLLSAQFSKCRSDFLR